MIYFIIVINILDIWCE